MFNDISIDELMKNTQKINGDMLAAQNELANLEIESKTEDNSVKVIMNGKSKFQKIIIDENMMHDKSKLEKSIIIALNNAVNLLEEQTMNKLLNLATTTSEKLENINNVYHKHSTTVFKNKV